MGIFELLGELCTVDSYFFKGWRYLFSTSYRGEAHRHWRSEGFLKSAPRILYALLLMAAEVVLILYLIRAVISWSRAE
jgi:hypothetical protein